MDRKEKMLMLLKFNDKFQEFMVKRFKSKTVPYPELTASWLDKMYDRFYMVESTRHTEEDFKVEIELRYALRSQEAYKYGERNQVFYDRYLKTVAVDIKYLNDPEAYNRYIDAAIEA